MPALARVSAWSGLLLLCSLSGCASMEPMSWRLPIGGPGPEPVEFLAEALSASPAAREALWQSLRSSDPGTDQKLRVALMQSVPEHSGYNRAAAQKRLRKLLTQRLNPGQRAVAQVRLNELESSSQCQVEVQSLRQRMAAVVDIERRLNGGR